MPNQFLNTREVAELLNITRPTLYKLTHNGTIKGSYLGKRLRYTKEDINSSLKPITLNLKPEEHE